MLLEGLEDRESAYCLCSAQERGELVFEPRRFVELRKKPFWQQFLSPESTGMGVFYTLNVFCIQAYPSPAGAWFDARDSWCPVSISMSKLYLASREGLLLII